MEITAYTINFSKQRAKQHKNVEAELVKKAQNLKQILAKKETQELLAEHDKIIKELESISLQHTRGACLRSKARWFEWGERSSEYFLNLEKRNYQNKYINKLKKDDRSTITDPTEILNEHQRFFQTLFSSQNPAVDDAKCNFLFDNDSIDRLNTEQQQHCEGMLTLDEDERVELFVDLFLPRSGAAILESFIISL